MRQRPRIYYTERQKALMWERWQKGDSLQQIAQLFDRNCSSVQGIVVQTGGIHTSRATTPLEIGADISRTRRNIVRGSRRSLDPIDSIPTQASAIHHPPRNPAQRWPAMVSGESSG
jgi:hypothetical protein